MIISKNAVGIIVLLLSVVGLEVGEDSILEVIAAVSTILGFTLMVWNQVSRSDTFSFFFKK